MIWTVIITRESFRAGHEQIAKKVANSWRHSAVQDKTPNLGRTILDIKVKLMMYLLLIKLNSIKCEVTFDLLSISS